MTDDGLIELTARDMTLLDAQRRQRLQAIRLNP